MMWIFFGRGEVWSFFGEGDGFFWEFVFFSFWFFFDQFFRCSSWFLPFLFSLEGRGEGLRWKFCFFVLFYFVLMTCSEYKISGLRGRGTGTGEELCFFFKCLCRISFIIMICVIFEIGRTLFWKYHADLLYGFVLKICIRILCIYFIFLILFLLSSFGDPFLRQRIPFFFFSPSTTFRMDMKRSLQIKGFRRKSRKWENDKSIRIEGHAKIWRVSDFFS